MKSEADPHVPPLLRRDVIVAVLLVTSLSTLYFALRQSARWSDGRSLIQLLEHGSWSYHHVLYLPIAQSVLAIAAPLGASAEVVLHGISAVGSAAAVALVYLCAISLGLRPASALLSALLLASTPAVWFYGTCIEVHSMQLAFASGAVLWAVRCSAQARPSAVVPALLFCGLFGSHMTGALWAPAFALLLFRHEGRWRWPRRLWLGVGIGAVCLGAWVGVTGGSGTGAGHALLGLRKLIEGWRFEFFRREVVEPSGFVLPLALVGVALHVWRERGAWRTPLARSALLLFACFLPFAFTLHIAERGAYFISLLPITSLCAGRALRSLGRWQIPAGLLLVALQALGSAREVREYEHEFPGWEWATVLFEETGEDGLVLTYDRTEWQAVWCHSRMATISLKARRTKQDLDAFTRQASTLIRRFLARGQRVAVTRPFYESQVPEVREIIDELVARFGRPTPGGHANYLYFPAERG